MIRTRVKGTGVKAAASPSTEPNFYDMEPCHEECDLGNQEVPIQCIPTVKSNESLTCDASMNLWMLPTVIPDETCSSENLSTCDSEDSMDPSPPDSIPLSPMNEIPDPVVSAPWSPQAVVNELEASVAEIGKYKTSRCTSPLASFLESSYDDFASVLLCHSGDEMEFEGQRFHYLDTDFFLKEDESPGLHVSSDVACLDECIPSLVEWQVDDTLGELFIST